MASAKIKNKNAVFWVLLGLLVLGLGGFGVESFSGSIRSIGKVGDRDIAVTTYARTLQQEIAAVSQQIGTPLAFAQAQALGLDRSARAKVVTSAALDNETARLGLSVGDDEVRRMLLDIAAFQGLDGKFDRAAYADTLARNDLNEAEFETQLREEAARTLLQGAIAAGVETSPVFAGAIYAYVSEKRGFTLITLDETALTEPVGVPDAAALQAYYAENPDEFTLAEAKTITYAKLLPGMLIDEVPVEDADIAALYQERIAEFVQPERRLVERLVFATEAEATAALASIAEGQTSFEALVAARGLVLSDVDLGDVAMADLGAAGPAVFALTEPGVVGPFASELGPALFRMNAVIAATATSLDQARDGLRDDLAQESARRMINDRISDIDDRLAGGATLEDLAGETGLELGTLDYRAGSDDPMAAYEAFRAAADTVTAEDFPEVISLEDGGIVVLRLDGAKPAELQPLDAVRDAVQAGWMAAEIRTRLLTRAQEVKTALTGGAKPETLGLPVQVIAPMTRDGAVNGAPDGLLAEVFKLAPGGVAVVESPGAVDVALLGEVVDVAPVTQGATGDAADLEQRIRAQVAQGLAQDLFTAYADALEAEAGIRLDEAAINAVHAQFQ